MKKRILVFFSALVMCMGLLVACKNTESENAENREFSVVCTIFPEYDWAKEIIGEEIGKYDLTLLLDNGVDLHSYQPTAQDIAKISNCDLFIYVGGESDEWVDDALKEASNKDMQVINLLEALGNQVKEEELVEGMEGEAEEEEEGEEEGPEYDEHVWLSLKSAETLSKCITDSLCKIDEAGSEIYVNNQKSFSDRLSKLDKKYEETVNSAAKRTVLFGDRFPFRYLTDDYGIDYYAAFVGCSAETEASFETVTFLAGKVDELSLKHVLVIESSDKKIAETIIENTADKDADILVLDSLQSVTSKDISKGATYLGIMEENLTTLSQALN